MVRPRDFLQNPELFGKALDAAWRKLPLERRDVFGPVTAAYGQHRFACGVEAALREDGRTIRWLAEETGLSEGQLSHILRGRQTMPTASMNLIADALGRIELIPAPTSLDDLKPPQP